MNADSSENIDRHKSKSIFTKSMQAKISLSKFGDIQKQNSNGPSLSLLL